MYKVIHFADALKRITRSVFKLSDWEVSTTEGKESKLPQSINIDDFIIELRKETGLDLPILGMVAESPRELLQFVGTNYIRATEPNYWLNTVRSEIEKGNVIVADLRFCNESDIIKEYGGSVVSVVRGETNSKDLHVSEMENLKIQADYVVLNNGTLDELANIAEGVIISLPQSASVS